jgi:hypothetical protein
MTAFRLEQALLERLDKYAEKLASETGLPVSRADVVRILLTRGLDDPDALSRRTGETRPSSFAT